MFPAEILITAVPRLTKVMASDVAIIKIRFLSRPLWALSKRKSTPDRSSCPTRIRPDVTGLLYPIPRAGFIVFKMKMQSRNKFHVTTWFCICCRRHYPSLPPEEKGLLSTLVF